MDKLNEKYRHQCEVRFLLKFRKEQGLQEFRKYLQNTGFKNRIENIKKDFSDQWKKGNKGNNGEWL